MMISRLTQPTFLIVLCFWGCQPQQSPNQQALAETDRARERKRISIVEDKFIEALWNERKFEVADEIFTEDFYTESFTFKPGNWIDVHGKGPESMIHHIKWWLTILPDAQLEVIDLVGHGDTVIQTWELTGTMEGALLGQAPLHKRLIIKGSTVLLFQEDRIKMNKTLLDRHGLMLQLGVLN